MNQCPTKDTSKSMLCYMEQSITGKHLRHSRWCSPRLSNHLILRFAVGHFIDPYRYNTLMSFPIAEFWDQYIDATLTIRKVIEETIHHMPHVLIDTETGHLYNNWTGHGLQSTSSLWWITIFNSHQAPPWTYSERNQGILVIHYVLPLVGVWWTSFPVGWKHLCLWSWGMYPPWTSSYRHFAG